MSAPPTRDELAELARAIPSEVRFGTSTWTYPGWTGLVYSQLYPESKATTRMLGEYARWPLFRTVGVDSSFYGPPKATTLASWAKVLPEGFLAVSKVWDRVTAFRFAGAREDAGRKIRIGSTPSSFETRSGTSIARISPGTRDRSCSSSRASRRAIGSPRTNS